MHALLLRLAVAAEIAGHGNHPAVVRVRGVVRHEADVQAHGVHAQQPGEVGNLLHLLEPRRAGFQRDQADRPLEVGISA